MTCLTKILISVMTTEPNWMGFSPRCRDNYTGYNPKPYLDQCTILKAIDAKSPIVIFTLGEQSGIKL